MTAGDTTDAMDIPTHLPNLKAIVWFDVRKEEGYFSKDLVDWSLSLDSEVAPAFKAFITDENKNKKWWLFLEDFIIAHLLW